MTKFAFLTLIVVGMAGFASAQESMSTPRTEALATFEGLKVQVESLIADKAEEVRKLEVMIAETEARAHQAQKEIEEYNRRLEGQREVLQFLHDRLNQSRDGSVLVVGNRHYIRDTVQVSMAARREDIAMTVQSRNDKECMVKEWKESIHRQKIDLNRVRKQLSKAKAALDVQQTRLERAAQELAISEIVQQTCPQGDLLFASDTELGRILSEIEVEVGTLEALHELRRSPEEIDLSDVRQLR